MTIWSAPRLARALDIDAKKLRDTLRKLFRDHENGAGWELDREMVAKTSAAFFKSGTVTSEKAEAVMDMFDQEALQGSAQTSPTSSRGTITTSPPEGVVYGHHEGAVRDAAAEILQRMDQGGSILSAGDVWTLENVDVLIERFVGQPRVEGGNFEEKLAEQLADVPDGPILLFAEIYALQMLPLFNVGARAKEANLEKVLGLSHGEYDVPVFVEEAFAAPVFSGGPAFTIHRYGQMSFLIRFVRHFMGMTPAERRAALDDALTWRQVVQSVGGGGGPAIRHALNYLAHPRFFFPIVGPVDRHNIIHGFFPEHTGRAASGDEDLDLHSLRLWLGDEEGATPSFYHPPLAEIWQAWDVAANDEEPEVQEGGSDIADYTVDSILAEGSFHESDELEAILDRWNSVKNIVLQGPPGTGKTWLARRLAYALIGYRDREAVRSVQFHPGTSYEDFVRGWRPGLDGKLELVDGPLLEHAERARDDMETIYVLVIEEFNRGNPAQALGEMLTLLESSKRQADDALELTYKHQDEPPFFLPPNLYIIGTMNTADRSLALVDFALRRRFAFFDLQPQFNSRWAQQLLTIFPGESKARIQRIADRVRQLNEQIAEDRSLGKSFQLGHSFFTPEDDPGEFEAWFSGAVTTSVGPQLSEYWPDDPKRVGAAVGMLLEGA